MTRSTAAGIAALVVSFIALGSAQQKPPAAPVDDAALQSPESRNQDWLSYGRDYYEQRFSPLNQINDGNVAQLGLAWQFETATERGLEATPLVIDGVMYTTGSWSVTYAIDARSGKQLWKYDPEVHRKYDNIACCDVVNRGARVLQGQALRRRARWPPRGARCHDRQGRLADDDRRSEAAVHDHRRAAHREWQGDHRQRRRRIRRARLRRPPTTRRPASSRGASTPCPAIPRSPRRTGRSTPRCRPGKAPSGGSTAAAARSWDSIVYDPELEPALRRHRQRLDRGTATCAAPAAATTSISRRSSRSIPTPASWCGTTRRRPATRGTTPRCSR